MSDRSNRLGRGDADVNADVDDGAAAFAVRVRREEEERVQCLSPCLASSDGVGGGGDPDECGEKEEREDCDAAALSSLFLHPENDGDIRGGGGGALFGLGRGRSDDGGDCSDDEDGPAVPLRLRRRRLAPTVPDAEGTAVAASALVTFPSSPLAPAPPSVSSLRKKALLLAALVLCLGLWMTEAEADVDVKAEACAKDVLPCPEANATIDDTDHLFPAPRRRSALVVALSRHHPSLRAFRVVSDCAFLLFCTAFSLWVWDRKDDDDGDDDIDETAAGVGGGVGRDAAGALLFAPVPDAAATNAAWRAYARARAERRRRLRRRRSSLSSRADDDAIEGERRSTTLLEMGARRPFPTRRAEGAEERGGRGSSRAAVDSARSREDDGDQGAFRDIADDDYDDDDDDAPENFPTPKKPTPPLASTILGVALDISVWTCGSLVLFALSSKSVAAPLFPMALVVLVAQSAAFPWKERRDLWTVISLTVGAPCYDVTFRDGFVGDILTSTVRPLQDLAYTAFFVPATLAAMWSHAYYGDDYGDAYDVSTAVRAPLEANWLLHTMILPACAISPLWWRFLQNLRQAYDNRRRWPYLGNAFKYFVAAQVAVFGMFHPSLKSNPIWISCFFGATLYQIWWDVFLDWELLEFRGRYRSGGGGGSTGRWRWPFALRSNRLYRSRWIYHCIFAVNLVLRFVGMITLIPPVYLSRSTGLVVGTFFFDPDFRIFSGIAVASAEIFRRAAWGLLRVELETLKTSSEEERRGGYGDGQTDDTAGDVTGTDGSAAPLSFAADGGDMIPMAIETSGDALAGGGWRNHFPWRRRRTTTKPSSLLESFSDMSDLDDAQILAELCVYATVFSSVALVAAAHREVL